LKRYRVKDLMVPRDEYAVIKKNATILEAVKALEAAQQEFDQTRYRHRAVLVEDENGHIVGKLGQLDILRSLEPGYEEIKSKSSAVSHLGFSKRFIESMIENYRLFEKPLEKICEKAGQREVHKYMHVPSEGEFIDEGTSLDLAIHLLVLGHHQSLLVTRGEEIIGILRMTDVFAAIFHTMKECFADQE
jgi:CBS domain-containing protein